MRVFTVSGLDDAVLTLYVPREALENNRLEVKKVIQYTIQDPTAQERELSKGRGKGAERRKKSEAERVLKWKVDPVTGGVVVEKVSGSVRVQY